MPDRIVAIRNAKGNAMSQFNDGMYRDSNLKIRNVTQAQFDAQKVNFNPDVIYRVDGVLHLPDESTETYEAAVTATRDASGNVDSLTVGADVLMDFIDVGGTASGSTVEV